LAITKILHMKSGSGGFKAKHLARSINYILNPRKTQDGQLIGAVNCQVGKALEQMRVTKELFGKTGGRQGYHIIISFKQDEVTPEVAFEITKRFTEEYLGQNYEAIYSMHDDTDHAHGHIVFNSVRFTDGGKFHYKKGDWAKSIQPITNKLCVEYGISTIDIEALNQDRLERSEESNRFDGRATSYSAMICKDIDGCIMLAPTYDTFIEMISEKGYEVKNAYGEGEYLKIRPPGRTRFRRLASLGENYSEERIRERLVSESLDSYNSSYQSDVEIMKHDYIKRYKRAPMSGLQKKYYAKLYKSGQLKKRTYSQAWKYRVEIEKMQALEKQYHFLVKHDIRSEIELADKVTEIANAKREANTEKSRAYRAERKYHALFGIAHGMMDLELARLEYERGDDFFCKEYTNWCELNAQLKAKGYAFQEVLELEKFHRNQKSLSAARERELFQELRIAKTIMDDLVGENIGIKIGKQKKSIDRDNDGKTAHEKSETLKNSKRGER